MNEYKVVTVKHQNCNIPYTFSVPECVYLNVGDYVLCNTKNHKLPQVARCITPSFYLTEDLLEELLNINPKHLQPIVGYLTATYFVQTDPNETSGADKG